jgi:hyperosmotically inducible protein
VEELKMKIAVRNCLAVMAIGLLCLGAASTARAENEPKTVSVEVSEALKAVTIQAKLIGKLGTDALRISVHVSGPTATLTGEVAKKSSQKMAESVALSVDGIKKVDNQVTQKTAPTAMANAEANVKDALLLTKVKTILLTDIGVNALKIDVDVTNGVVSLRGKLGNAEVNEEAMRKTRSIKGVKKVINLLA